MALLDPGDRAALALLPDDRKGAAQGFVAGFGPLVTRFRAGAAEEIVAGFGSALCTRDRELLRDPQRTLALGTSMKEALSQGAEGAGWDNVAWAGPWEIDLRAISCPVLLRYGAEDRFCPPQSAEWLRANLPDATLVLRTVEGHLGFMEHTAELLDSLTA